MAERTAKPRNDAYTGLLAISLLALIAGTVLMAMDASELGTPPPKVSIDVGGGAAGKGGAGLSRPDAGKADATPNPADKKGGKQ